MNMKIGRNIRIYRKQLGLTQEKLAEAVNVTVGAVSKWESGLSNPDIAMLPELADLFEVSVDVLLGYQLNCKTAKQTSEKIYELRMKKKIDEGKKEANKALQRYPNNFDIVYQSAVLFNFIGVERSDKASIKRSLDLYNKSCALISQNTNEKVSELSINIAIAELYISMGKIDLALTHLKKNNDCGINNETIGMILSQNDQCEEAFPYLSDAFSDNILKLFLSTLGLSICHHNVGKEDLSREVILWMYHLLDGLKIPGQISYLDRMQVILLTACAQSATVVNDTETAEKYLRRALNLGLLWETEKLLHGGQAYSIKNIKFYCGDDKTAGDGFGENIVDGIKNCLSLDKKSGTVLMQLWRKIENEE